jgi:hypothetical protein
MSASPPLAEPTRLDRFCIPIAVTVGFVVGLLLLAWAGRHVARTTWHHDFVRFHPMLAPDSHYQPTVAEMKAIVRAQCRPDQILVIIGGNSIFLGVGQPVERLWSKRLQELLGDQFAVVNLAFRGAQTTDGAAIVAESLRDEFPRQIYLTNTAPLMDAPPTGLEAYRFILLDAYYKGWLLPWPPRDERLKWELDSTEQREKALGLQIDAWLHQRTFWNWWSFTRFFTFPTPMSPDRQTAFRGRGQFPDREPDYEERTTAQRFSGPHVAHDLEIARLFTAASYRKDEAGQWHPIEVSHRTLSDNARAAFPDPVKKRTVIAISRNSPFYTQQMPPDIQERDEIGYAATLQMWRDAGYHAFEFGRDFTPDDYGDRTHLTSTGGVKLAAITAEEVRKVARSLGYLTFSE